MSTEGTWRKYAEMRLMGPRPKYLLILIVLNGDSFYYTHLGMSHLNLIQQEIILISQ